MNEGAARTWLVGGRVVDVASGTASEVQVAVAEGRITDLVPGLPTLRAGKHTGVHEMFLLPGLIDCHVHLVMRGEDPDPSANASRSDEEIQAYAAHAAEKTLLGGVTTVRDVR